MKILILGSWRKEVAINYKTDAEEVGELIALRGHEIISGAGTGISQLVVNSYRKHKGKKYTAYLPSKKEMENVGEEVGPKPDEIIQTNLDYPERNIYMIKRCEGIFVLPGGLGTLTEILLAVRDYNKKVVCFDKGETAEIVKKIPGIKEKVYLTKDVSKGLDWLEK